MATKKKKKKTVAAIPQATLPLSKIFVPENTREAGWEKRLDTIRRSIQASGLKQPIGVWAYPKDQEGPDGTTHELVFGQRRFFACKALKWTMIPVVFEAPKSTPKDRFTSSLAENDAREDPSPYGRALAFRRAIDEYGMKANDIAARLGVSSAFVSQRLALLKMSDEVQTAIKEDKITFAHARVLNTLDEADQIKMLPHAQVMPVTEFKEKIATSDTKEKVSKRGRKEKRPVLKVRTPAEIGVEMGKIDVKRVAAHDAGNTKQEHLLTGALRALGWATGNAKTSHV